MIVEKGVVGLREEKRVCDPVWGLLPHGRGSFMDLG
jgi:hypothetical protein